MYNSWGQVGKVLVRVRCRIKRAKVRKTTQNTTVYRQYSARQRTLQTNQDELAAETWSVDAARAVPNVYQTVCTASKRGRYWVRTNPGGCSAAAVTHVPDTGRSIPALGKLVRVSTCKILTCGHWKVVEEADTKSCDGPRVLVEVARRVLWVYIRSNMTVYTRM